MKGPSPQLYSTHEGTAEFHTLHQIVVVDSAVSVGETATFMPVAASQQEASLSFWKHVWTAVKQGKLRCLPRLYREDTRAAHNDAVWSPRYMLSVLANRSLVRGARHCGTSVNRRYKLCCMLIVSRAYGLLLLALSSQRTTTGEAQRVTYGFACSESAQAATGLPRGVRHVDSARFRS